MLIINADDVEHLQSILADRSIDPSLQDVNRLYKCWRSSDYGCDDNGEGLYTALEPEIEKFNSKWGAQGGKAMMQRYEVITFDRVETSDTEDITPSNKHSTHYQSQKFNPLSLQHVLL